MILLFITIGIIIGSIVLDYGRFLASRKRVIASLPTIHTSYGEVSYIDIGPREGPVILFSTGGGAGIDYAYSFDWLLKEGFRIVAVNRPGYYGLPVDVAASIKEHADLYNEVVQTLGIEEVHVFGVSMGGLSALYYAERYPVKSMVLWSAVTGDYHPNEEALHSPLGKLMMTDKGKNLLSWAMVRSAQLFPKATVRQFVQAEADMSKQKTNEIAGAVTRDPAERRRLIQFVQSLTPMSALYDGMMDELEKSASPAPINWEALTMPVFAVHSTIDRDVGIEHFERVQQHVTHGEFLSVKAGGHFVWWGEEGKEVIQRTVKFLKENEL
ncbi:hypothetical protein N781_08215 [Pontibacillus halophilus JSM 076056 = DSM 19796]|uniref:AB hydrolase-1 domain-containing protein n=1 Tax=Pontibacillus halophilus JSM 076056 = DSM 19796 TaxID=1385510 RepID=A0A0A5I342_9BACI|nr:alpha/beta hydrolase [Pontibacillus halophilus]KGX90257.1 hypothetical protein N781_08215 [Pontibacillus halophilus JSM 076056 = DSM 19796]